MRLHILVEGPSEVAFLEGWLPRFLGKGHTFRIIVHQGKGRLPADLSAKIDPKRRGLLDQLPGTLRAYGRTLQSDTDRVVVLLDADNNDCVELLQRLNRVVAACNPAPAVLFRIATEETEAFFLGDAPAIKRAYPGAKTGRLRSHEYDSICGTWELLRDIIGDDPSSEDKVGWAKAIGLELGIRWSGSRGVNRSPSFQRLCAGLQRHCGDEE